MKMTKTKEKKWQKFEKLVASIQKTLAPKAKIIHDDKVRGKISNTLRQIDISIRQNVGQYSLFVAIECKDYKDPVDINTVEEFKSKLKDISANKGAIVSASGFTKAAKNIAIDAGIDLYRLVDTDKHDGQAYVSMPILCDFRKLKNYRYLYKSSTKGPFEIDTFDPKELLIYKEDGSLIDIALNMLFNNWNKGLVPREPGIHENIKLTDFPIFVKTKGNLYPIGIFVDIKVEKNLYFGQLPIVEIKGFRDEKTGEVITNRLRTDWLDTVAIEKNWQKIGSKEDLAIQPTLELIASDHYPLMKIKTPEKL